MPVEFTRWTVEKAKPQAKPYELRAADPRGLILRVQPSGRKSYVVEFGRGVRRTIGDAQRLMLDQAKTTARAWLAEKASQKLPEAARGPARSLTLGEFMAAEYEPWALAQRKAGAATVASIKATWSRLFDVKLSAIDAATIQRMVTDRLAAGRSRSTVNRDVGRLRAVLHQAAKLGKLRKDLVPAWEPLRGDDERRVRFLSAEEGKRLQAALEARENARRAARDRGNAHAAARGYDERPTWKAGDFTDHLMPLVLVALHTGLRRGELFSLLWSDVDLIHRNLTVRAAAAKAQRRRDVPLNATAVATLKRWKRQGTGEGRVFPSDEGARLDNVKKGWAALCEAADLQDFRFHDLRHDFASRLVMAGVPLAVAKELLGHASITMTERYAHLSPETKRRAVDLVG